MKLRNKLIPLASVFATGAVLAPVALTSCSAGGLVDLTNGNYVPSTKKAVTEGYVASDNLATELEAAAINENPTVLEDDKYWGDAIMIKGFADLAGINVTSIKAKASNIKITYVTVTNLAGEDVKIPTISMKYTIATEMNWYVGEGGAVDKTSVERKTVDKFGCPLYYQLDKYRSEFDTSLTAKTFGNMYSNTVYETEWENIPFAAFEFDEDIAEFLPSIVTKWFFHPSLENLALMTTAKLDWKYSVKYTNEHTFVFDKDGKTSTLTNGNNFQKSFTDYIDLCSGSEEAATFRGCDLLNSEMFASYYLSNIAKAE